MDVVETENLQENARTIGEYLLAEGSKLGYDFDMIGDVRGLGLFVGFEMVKSKACKTPATQEAQWIVDRMKSVHRILISSDGPHDNVLKLKPPMVFNKENADEFLAGFKECLLFLHEVICTFDRHFDKELLKENVIIENFCFVRLQINYAAMEEEMTNELQTRKTQEILIKAM